MSSVHQSLKYGEGHRSNQQEVWNDISQLQSNRNAHSPTSAMKDIYDKEKDNLDDFLKAFPLIEGQCGIIVGLGGQVVGLEYLSSSDCYLDVHSQLIESYTMDALVEKLSGVSPELTLEESQRFLEQIWSASQETFRSAAAGTDVRLESEHLVGMIRLAKEHGVGVILIDHHMDFLEQLVDEVVTFDAGREIYRGDMEGMRADRAVVEAYLGKEEESHA